MGRVHFFEIIDHPRCPSLIREGVTDYLQSIAAMGNLYRRALPPFRKALERAGTHQVVDLGSGAGGPWRAISSYFVRDTGYPLEITLTDLYPNKISIGWLESAESSLRRHPEPVDARKVPTSLEGFRTLFSLFHHFKPADARAILEDAVRSGQGIAVFEMTHRSVLAVVMMLMTPLMAFLITPFIRPFKVSRLLLTYAIPIIPVVTAFDGVVSCLRTYSVEELLELTVGLSEGDYRWEAATVSTFPASPIPVTYLVGCPASSRRDIQGNPR